MLCHLFLLFLTCTVRSLLRIRDRKVVNNLHIGLANHFRGLHISASTMWSSSAIPVQSSSLVSFLEGTFCFVLQLLNNPNGISSFFIFSIQSEIKKVLLIPSENSVNVSRKFGS